VDPGPQTIIAAGQTQAPGFGSIIMIGTSQFCHAAERMVYLRRRLQPVHSRHFLLTSLLNKGSGYMENPLRQSFFRAGHAHAGVIVVLSLLCQMLADSAVLPVPLLWLLRVGVPLSAILISAGFFFSVLPPTATQAGGSDLLDLYRGRDSRRRSYHARHWVVAVFPTQLVLVVAFSHGKFLDA